MCIRDRFISKIHDKISLVIAENRPFLLQTINSLFCILVTWYKANGKKYDLPIRLGNAEYACRIPQNSELINQRCV